MNNLYIKIFSIIFSLLVLLSSTGILLVYHTCIKCESNDWHLFSIVNCQNNILEPTCCIEDTHDESECNKEDFINTDKPCCSNNGLFYKVGLFFSDVDDTNIDFLDGFQILNDNRYVVKSPCSIIGDNLFRKSPPLISIKPYILFEVFRT